MFCIVTQKKFQTRCRPVNATTFEGMKKWNVIFLMALVACQTRRLSQTVPTSSFSVDGKFFASVYQQKAAEYKALCFQAYNMAKLRVDALVTQAASRPRAIITDIDETVLDNSDYAIHQALKGQDYDFPSWAEWTSRIQADTVPGAPSFLHYAASKGFTIFYITNRDEKERASTLQNLVKFNLPNADNDHLTLKTSTSSKEERRQRVMANYDVVMLIGDNLGDFSAFFDKRPQAERESNTVRFADEFGARFIVLPNSTYGDWESALFNYKAYTAAQKDSILKAAVRTY